MKAAIYTLLLLVGPLLAGTPEAMVLLKANCFSCHNPEKEKGGLDLTTRAGLLRGSDEGKAIIPGKAPASRLIQVIQTGSDPHMPPKGQLTPRAISMLENWVNAGAPWDATALKDKPRPAPAKLGKLPPSYTPALAVTLAPDGKRLALARANTIFIHDLTAKNKRIATLTGHRDAVQSLAWSADGKWLASGGYRSVRLWNTEWKLARELTGFAGRVTAIVFSPDNTTLFTADDGHVRTWSVADGKPASNWQAHQDTVYGLALSRDGKQIATASADETAKVWSVVDKNATATLEGHHGAVYAVAFKSDGKQLATGSADHEMLVWDLQSKQKLTEVRNHKGGVTALRWTPDDKALVTSCEDGLARIFTDIKPHDGAQRSGTAKERKLAGASGRLHSIATSADTKTVVAGNHAGDVFIWQNNRLTATLKAEAAAEPKGKISFIKDVLPILSKAGCSAGSCHAKAGGQHGFQLSVFAYDTHKDWREITADAHGRRVFPAFPSESLIVKKATLAMPHEGGQRIKPGSNSDRVLRQWIRDGMAYQHEGEPLLTHLTVEPAARIYRMGQTQHLKVTAHFSNDSRRDVTALTKFVSNDTEMVAVDEAGRVTVGRMNGEGTLVVRYMGQVAIARVTVPAAKKIPAANYAALPANNFIDELAYAQFQRLGLLPSELCSDAEFLRRASLDTIGRLPTVEEARTFLDDKTKSPAKRRALIERLLKHPAYGDYWANKWADLVRPNPDRAGLKSVYVLDQWLREAFRANQPMDQFARAMITASGSTHRFGPAVVYRDKRTPDEMAKIFSQAFLGTRLECARCHNHPNEKWTQSDFYSLAAYFAQVKRKGSGVSPPISGGTEFFYHGGSGSVKHPVTGNILAPKPPAGPPAQVAVGADPRAALVDWIVRPDNPFFARAMVNRVWGVYFGRGLVNPVDDLRASNPAMNAALLDALATHFVKIKFDQKALIRTVMQSRLYQLSHTPNESNTADTRNFSRMYLRRLRAEVLMDAINDVTGVPSSFAATWPGARAIETWNFKISSEFLDAFGRPNSSSDPPCERNTSGTIVQALHLMHGDGLQKKITHAKGRARRLADSKKTVAEIADEVYLAALSRRPTKNETVFVEKFYQGHNNAKDAEDGENNRRTATEDFIWAIINSAEFVFNH
jgi:WD40 repeat protein